jgi:hypothetical protein
VDNQATLFSIRNHIIRQISANTTIQVLTDLGLRYDVLIKWIKAYIGFHKNETADQAAKNGSNSNRMGPITPVARRTVWRAIHKATQKS